MTYYTENPFISASSRDIVESPDFIGRKDDLQQIENRVILPPSEHQRASVAIIGLPDVGKHCLINKALLTRKTELHQRRLVPIEMDLTTYMENDKHDKFFRDLVSLCKYELEDEDLAFATSHIPNIDQLTKNVLREWDEGGKTISTLKRFFRTVQRAKIRVIFILDNFDHADSLFKEHISRIRWLRDLAGTECQVTWIALSCKPIREIKRLPKSISDDFFYEHRLGMFTDEDMKAYFQFLAHMGIPLSEESTEAIKDLCGNHPYLLSLLGYHLVENYAHQPNMIDFEHIFNKVEERFKQSYDRIIDLVLINDENDEKLQKLKQMLSNKSATSNVEQKDINRMLAYNLIYPNPSRLSAQERNQPAYIAFSKHFQNYLHSKLLSIKQKEPEQSINWKNIFSGSQTLYPGNRLWGRYEIHDILEPTGHSRIMKAWDEKLQRYAAIKVVYLDPAYEAVQLERFQEWLKREARIICRMKHENIAQVYDLKEDAPAIIMRWIDGKSLDQFWGMESTEKSLSAIQITRWCLKLAGALDHIHKEGIVHRDIKPKNIIISTDKEPILIDFDAARAVGKEVSILADLEGDMPSFVGTLKYSAPEQTSNPQNITPSVDIYSLGVVLYESLTSSIPDRSEHWKHFQHARIPNPIWLLLQSMLSKDPLSRPNAQQLCQKLEHCLEQLETE